MALKLSSFKREIHEQIVLPWFANKGDAPVIAWLPDTTYMVYDDERPLAVGSLILTNSPICFMEHFATNHKEPQISQGKALRFLALALEQLAQNSKYAVILGLVPEDHFSLVEFYKRQGAQLGSKLMRVTYKMLGGA